MISVLISSESRYRFEREKVRQKVEEFLRNSGIEEVEVSLAVVGTRKILKLNRDFRQVEEVTDVLSFPQEAGRGPDGVLRLGDIVICYPVCREEARLENKFVSQKLEELVEHGLRHLLGEHHE